MVCANPMGVELFGEVWRLDLAGPRHRWRGSKREPFANLKVQQRPGALYLDAKILCV